MGAVLGGHGQGSTVDWGDNVEGRGGGLVTLAGCAVASVAYRSVVMGEARWRRSSEAAAHRRLVEDGERDGEGLVRRDVPGDVHVEQVLAQLAHLRSSTV